MNHRIAYTLFLSCLILPTCLHAAIHHVDASASAGGDGTDWDTAFTDLQTALATAAEGDVIHVAAGVYYPDEGAGQVEDALSSSFQLKSGVTLLGGFPVGGGHLEDRDPRTHLTTLSGDIDQNDTGPLTGNLLNAYHVVTASGVDATAVLDGFVITAGHADGSGSDRRGGGLFAVEGGSPTVRNCDFTGNYGQIGGGAYICSDAAPTFTNCSFTGNEAAFGGGMYTCINASPTLINCLFLGNDSSSSGGAVYSDLDASATYINCTFTGNSARRRGGAVFNTRESSPQFINCIIWNNLSDGSTTTADASVANDTDSFPTYTHSLIANSGGSANWDTALGTDNGNNIDLNPLFIADSDPLLAPSTEGDARLMPGSSAVDAGNTADNPVEVDLAGMPRVEDAAIDLGAYEGASGPSFSRILYVDTSATGDMSGLSWEDAYPHLQDALLEAESGEAIFVAMGRYYPDEGSGQTDDDRLSTFQLKSGVAVFGGFPEGGGELSIRNPATNPTVLSGDIDQNDEAPFINTSGNAYNVVTAFGVGDTALLDGFTVTSGNAFGDSDQENRGGGIRIAEGGSPVIRDCVFLSNFASVGGGADICEDAFPTFLNCAFIGNAASFGGGAFICIRSEPELVNCIFQGNHASRQGGALYNDLDASPTITNTTFSGNRSDVAGGAVYNTRASFPVFTNCILWDNVADGSGETLSASIANDASSFPVFSHSLIAHSGGSSNWATAAGIDNGNNLDADPLFLLQPEPLAAPDIQGALKLTEASPALDAGHSAPNTTAFDLAGRARVQETAIDLGAYEGAFTPRFASFYPRLDKMQDSNRNGRANFADYAMGGNPLGLYEEDWGPILNASENGLTLRFSKRFDVEDVFVLWQKSPTLQPDSWTPLQEAADYVGLSLSTEGLRLFSELELQAPAEQELYYRQVFKDTPF